MLRRLTVSQTVRPPPSLLLLCASRSRAFHTTPCALYSASSPIIHKSPITQLLWRQRSIEQNTSFLSVATDADALAKLPPTSEVRFSPRTPATSYARVTYAFSTDPGLCDKYTNCWGSMDKGILFEDMDAISGNVAFRHLFSGTSEPAAFRPPLLVTAKVNEIITRGSIRTDSDVHLEAFVVHVGASSIRIRSRVLRVSPQDGTEELYLVSDSVFVARDRVTNRATPVPPLTLDSATEDQRALFKTFEDASRKDRELRSMHRAAKLEMEAAELSDAHKLLERSQALLRMPCLPTAVVAASRSGAGGRGNAVMVPETAVQNTVICQPQKRNTAGRVFGGFLMRRGYELALATAYCFAGSTPRFLWSDEVSFHAPVNIGDVLRFEGTVVWSEPERANQRVHVEVLASVLQPEKASSQISNRFIFSFMLDKGSPHVAEVFPTNTSEARKQLHLATTTKLIDDWKYKIA